MVWEVRATHFFPKAVRWPAEAHWLLAAHHVLTGERKYFLSNAPAGTPLEVLLGVAFSRAGIGQLFGEAKGEVGLDHFEVRNFLSLQRHLILSAVSLLFLSRETHQLREKNRWWSAAQVRVAAETQLDPADTRCHRARRVARAVRHIQYWQARRRSAQHSHRKSALRQLHKRGIFISRCRRCVWTL